MRHLPPPAAPSVFSQKKIRVKSLERHFLTSPPRCHHVIRKAILSNKFQPRTCRTTHLNLLLRTEYSSHSPKPMLPKVYNSSSEHNPSSSVVPSTEYCKQHNVACMLGTRVRNRMHTFWKCQRDERTVAILSIPGNLEKRETDEMTPSS